MPYDIMLFREESRVCQQAKGERNYHIFYQLLARDQQQHTPHSHAPSYYYYLNQSECTTIQGVNDSDDFHRMDHAMHFKKFGSKVHLPDRQVQNGMGFLEPGITKLTLNLHACSL